MHTLRIAFKMTPEGTYFESLQSGFSAQILSQLSTLRMACRLSRARSICVHASIRWNAPHSRVNVPSDENHKLTEWRHVQMQKRISAGRTLSDAANDCALQIWLWLHILFVWSLYTFWYVIFLRTTHIGNRWILMKLLYPDETIQ